MNSVALHQVLSLETAGILILACAVLIFSMNHKYSLIVNRIRLLKEEKGKVMAGEEKPAPSGSKLSNAPLSNIDLQISHLIHRISMVRFSMICFAFSILLLITYCVLVVARPASATVVHYWVTVSFLLFALLGIATGVVLTSIETWKGYRVVRIEISETR